MCSSQLEYIKTHSIYTWNIYAKIFTKYNCFREIFSLRFHKWLAGLFFFKFLCLVLLHCIYLWSISNGFPGSSDGKESVCNVWDPSSIPGLGRTPGEGNGYPLQYSCLENSMDRGAWQATVHGLTKSQRQLND